MGLFSRKIEAQAAPQVLGDRLFVPNPLNLTAVTRNEAMTVPSVARCRNLIAGTIASIPMELYRKSTGEELGKPVWLEQPSYHQPRSVTLAWTVDSLIMWGVAYWRVVEVYQEDGRPARFEWVANSRVSTQLDALNNYVKSYAVDGTQVPNDGLGSLITFQAFDEGILARGGSTIRAAIDVQNAARVAASTPSPVGYLKNNGADLPPAEVQSLLAAWRAARQQRSTAYLTSTLSYETVGFSPKDMLYNEAIQNLSTEISRLMNVPSYLLSADQNTSMTYSNIQDERKQFVALSLQPYISAIEDRLSMNDVTANGNIVRFAVADTFLRHNPLDELAVIEKLLQLQLITTEQAMEMTDLTPNGAEGMLS